MKTYELTYIISSEITSEEAEAKAKEIEAAISSREGTILKQSNPIAKTLSYPKRASGFFGVLEFQLEPEKLLELKEMVSKDGKIVRHMLIIKEAQRIRKERRSRVAPILEVEQKIEEPAFTKENLDVAEEEKPAGTKPTIEKEKVELKDIDQQLNELLG